MRFIIHLKRLKHIEWKITLSEGLGFLRKDF